MKFKILQKSDHTRPVQVELLFKEQRVEKQLHWEPEAILSRQVIESEAKARICHEKLEIDFFAGCLTLFQKSWAQFTSDATILS